jgi:signal transduction histidine kinase
MEHDLTLSWPRIAAFVRQHTHDVRNHLNSLDLEAALLLEGLTQEEDVESANRLRKQIRDLAAHLRTLSLRFAEPAVSPIPIAASEVFLIWQDQLREIQDPPQVQWHSEFGAEQISIDAMSIGPVFKELLTNARDFPATAPLQAMGRAEAGAAVYELREPKEAPVEVNGWGYQPFETTRRGGYGLGLLMVRRVVEANGGKVVRSFDNGSSELVTILRFPLA